MSTSRKVLFLVTIPLWLPLLCVAWVLVGCAFVVAASVSLLLPR